MTRMENWRMKDVKKEGEVVDWIPAPNGGYIGIVKGDDGGVYTIKSADCANAGQISVGKRVRYSFETFRNDDGECIEGTDAETHESYGTGATREVEVI